MFTPPTLIALPVAVSLFPLKVLFRARIILVTITRESSTKNFVAVLAPFLQPTGGLVDTCNHLASSDLSCIVCFSKKRLQNVISLLNITSVYTIMYCKMYHQNKVYCISFILMVLPTSIHKLHCLCVFVLIWLPTKFLSK